MAGQSTQAVLGSQEHEQQLLQKLAGNQDIEYGSAFWNQLFNLQLPLASQDPSHKLVLHMLDLVGLAQNGKPSLAVANSLHMVSVIIQFIVETCSPDALSMVFEAAPTCQQQRKPDRGPPPRSASQPLLEALMEQQQSASALVGALLQLVVARQPLPGQSCSCNVPAADGSGTSVMRLVRTAAATVLWIPLRTYQYIVRHSSHADGPPSPLSGLALSLLLVLAHYPAHHAQLVNGVKAGLQALQDDAAGSDAEQGGRVSSGAGNKGQPSISFAACPQSEGSTLLLYTLLHGSKSFQEYVLVRSDPETLLVPLLQQLYKADKRRANHLYMLQIIVLILSQDTSFSHNIHKVMLPGNVPWYRERVLSKVSLGSLVFVVLLRTAHQNVGQLQDLYLPTNTLAALANLAPQVSGLHSHAAQRLVGLTSLLARRWLKISQVLAGSTPSQDMQVLHDFLRILLEVINTVLSLNLGRNPELVYALLHRQEVFGQLRGREGLAELIDNLQSVIDFFNSKLDSINGNQAAAPEGQAEWSVVRVLELVQTFAQSWRGERLKQLPELRFVYEEEAAPEEFFVPYCWSLAVAATGGRLLSWNLGAVALLSQVDGAEGEEELLEGQPSNTSSSWSEEAMLADSQV
ncbi:Dyggve-Melchior-Clausen syndrome protein-domain-containing protein [Scenedesmus sp. NREL 46B-D3]|nr:Dyggve-Melchior-Clausen syndrome protein-domain-containing protein [Scenedesmus sp. NREL 46B-D3]